MFLRVHDEWNKGGNEKLNDTSTVRPWSKLCSTRSWREGCLVLGGWQSETSLSVGGELEAESAI